MVRRYLLRILLAVTVWPCVPAARAQQALPFWSATNRPTARAVYSVNHRFLITGQDTLAIARVSLFAEDVADRTERSLESVVPSGARNSVKITLHTDKSLAGSDVEVGQLMRGRNLFQTVRITNVEKADVEVVAEALVRVFVGQIAHGRVARDGVQPPLPHVPAWMSMGLTQTLTPELRSRNHDIMSELIEDGRAPGVADAFAASATKPVASEVTRAAQGMAYTWLSNHENKDAVREALLMRIGRGESITLSVMGEQLAGVRAEKQFGEAWGRWLRRRTTTLLSHSVVTPRVVAQLREQLFLEQPTPEPSDPARSVRVEFRELIDRRREEWIHTAVLRRIVELNRLAFGRPREFVSVVNEYRGFLTAMTKRARNLAQMLEEADAALAALEARVDPAKNRALP